MSDILMACPFCGGQAALHDTTGGWWQAGCAGQPYAPRCGARTDQSTNKVEALSFWNRRSEAAGLVDAATVARDALHQIMGKMEYGEPLSMVQTAYDALCSALPRRVTGDGA